MLIKSMLNYPHAATTNNVITTIMWNYAHSLSGTTETNLCQGSVRTNRRQRYTACCEYDIHWKHIYWLYICAHSAFPVFVFIVNRFSGWSRNCYEAYVTTAAISYWTELRNTDTKWRYRLCVTDGCTRSKQLLILGSTLKYEKEGRVSIRGWSMCLCLLALWNVIFVEHEYRQGFKIQYARFANS